MLETLKQSGKRLQGLKKSNESNLFCGLILHSIFTGCFKLSQEITSTLFYLYLVIVSLVCSGYKILKLDCMTTNRLHRNEH